MKNKRLIIILAVVGVLLLIPLIAMQFTNEVHWSGFDFLVMGILLLGTGLVCELVFRTIKKRTNRLIVCLAVLGVFILVWMELAVGIFGTPFAGS
jgi:D-alanyl-lipoteichoic acid acyltransferase DltB (MBOAT superfamily)